MRPESGDADTAQIPKNRPWKLVLFFAVMLSMTGAALEIGAVVFLKLARGYDGKHLLQYSFDPYKNILPTPGYEDTRGVRHNSVGFRRDGEVPLAKAAGTFRVFLMGGSTAFGTGGLWSHIDPANPVLHNNVTIDRFLE